MQAMVPHACAWGRHCAYYCALRASNRWILAGAGYCAPLFDSVEASRPLNLRDYPTRRRALLNNPDSTAQLDDATHLFPPNSHTSNRSVTTQSREHKIHTVHLNPLPTCPISSAALSTATTQDLLTFSTPPPPPYLDFPDTWPTEPFSFYT